jgi:hypothetical protein
MMSLKFKTILCFIMMLVCACLLQAQDGKKEGEKKNNNISTKYNKSKNLTTVTLKSMALKEASGERAQTGYQQRIQMDMDAFFTYPGEKVEKPVENVTLRFRATSNLFNFARAQQVSIVLDEKVEGREGKVLKLGDTDYKSNQNISIFEEFLTIGIPADTLAKIGEAKTVDIFLGGYGYSLKEKQIADLRDFASRAKP